jgi:hypothetical protein
LSFVLLTAKSVTPPRHYGWAKLFVQEQIAKGKKHPTAVRALAFKWQRIMFVCWRECLPYDETTYPQQPQTPGLTAGS